MGTTPKELLQLRGIMIRNGGQWCILLGHQEHKSPSWIMVPTNAIRQLDSRNQVRFNKMDYNNIAISRQTRFAVYNNAFFDDDRRCRLRPLLLITSSYQLVVPTNAILDVVLMENTFEPCFIKNGCAPNKSSTNTSMTKCHNKVLEVFSAVTIETMFHRAQGI